MIGLKPENPICILKTLNPSHLSHIRSPAHPKTFITPQIPFSLTFSLSLKLTSHQNPFSPHIDYCILPTHVPPPSYHSTKPRLRPNMFSIPLIPTHYNSNIPLMFRCIILKHPSIATASIHIPHISTPYTPCEAPSACLSSCWTTRFDHLL